MEWSVPSRYVVIEGGAALVFATAAAVSDDRVAGVVAATSALLLAALAVRDHLLRVRLSADADGIALVHGIARRRRLSWRDIVSIKATERVRAGRTAPLLEIDAGDAIYLLSVRELGARPAEVAAALGALRP